MQTSEIVTLESSKGHNGENTTSLAWSKEEATATYLAQGLRNSDINVWDTERSKVINTIHQHSDRVSSLNWCGVTLASGSKDSLIHVHDSRSETAQMTMKSHYKEVCGLKWSADGSFLASGSNDNRLCIWDI